jgi:D-threo-aldose 1-dehydrogenase
MEGVMDDGIGPPLAGSPGSKDDESPPGSWAKRRLISDTGVAISTVGVGGGPIGNLFAPMDDADADRLLRAGVQRGVRYFDTAPLYGLGLAETRLGRALAHYPRDRFVVSTKVGRLLVADAPPDPDMYHNGEPFFKDAPALNPIWDFSREGTSRSLEESLTRLGLGGIDIALLHEPPDRCLRQAVDEGYQALRDLRHTHAVRAIGIGWDRVDIMAQLVTELDLDCILVAGRYTLLDQSALDRLMPACLNRNVAVVVGGVFNSGILADPSATCDYVPATRGIRERVQMLKQICERWSAPLKSVALQFPLGHPAVAGIVLGMRTVAELTENLELVDFAVPPGLWHDLKHAGLLPEAAPIPGDRVSYDDPRLGPPFLR